MKKSEIILQTDQIGSGEKPKKTRAGNMLRYLLFSFFLSWIILLSACAVEYGTPHRHYESFGVIINPWNYEWREEHHEWVHEHPHWRHEYPRHRDDDDD